MRLSFPRVGDEVALFSAIARKIASRLSVEFALKLSSRRRGEATISTTRHHVATHSRQQRICVCQEQTLCKKLHAPDLRGDTMQGDAEVEHEDVDVADVASERCDSEEGTRWAAWKQFCQSFSLDD